MEGPRGYLLKDLVTEKETENCYDHFSAFWLRSSAENCYQKEWLLTSEKLSCLYSDHMKTLREPGDFSLWKKIWGKINSVIRFGGKKKKREDSWESLGQQGDQMNQSKKKSTLNIHQKDWCWSWSSSTLATWWEKPNNWKRPWF